MQAIAPKRLARIRDEGNDGHGNEVQGLAASGQGEPLRCCPLDAPQRFLYSVVAG